MSEVTRDIWKLGTAVSLPWTVAGAPAFFRKLEKGSERRWEVLWITSKGASHNLTGITDSQAKRIISSGCPPTLRDMSFRQEALDEAFNKAKPPVRTEAWKKLLGR